MNTLPEIRELSSKKFEKKLQDRPYQTRLINEVVDDWRGSNKYNSKIKTSLIELPPGGGKTLIAFRLAKMFKEMAKEIAGWNPKDVGIGWIAGRRNLLKQAEKENNEMIKCEDVHFISQFSSDINDNKLLNYKHKLIVIDEAHHEACSTMHSLINIVDPEYMLGLSATPRRTDKAKLCFQKSYKSAGFYDLIDEGWLSQFDHWNISDWKPETVVTRYLEDPQKWGKSIMFFQDRAQCDMAVNLLKRAGIKVDLVTGNTDRDEQLDLFENGDTDVLINMFVLTEGFDFPGLKTVFVRDSGQLPTIQMAGRVLRPFESLPVVNIVQSIKTPWPFIRTADIAHKQFVWSHDGWQRIDRNDKLDKAVMKSIKITAGVDFNNDVLKQLRMKNKSFRRRNRRRNNNIV